MAVSSSSLLSGLGLVFLVFLPMSLLPPTPQCWVAVGKPCPALCFLYHLGQYSDGACLLQMVVVPGRECLCVFLCVHACAHVHIHMSMHFVNVCACVCVPACVNQMPLTNLASCPA